MFGAGDRRRFPHRTGSEDIQRRRQRKSQRLDLTREDPDWAVVTGNGNIGAGDEMGNGKMKEAICAAIKKATFTRESYDMDFAHARGRFCGNIATLTANLSVSGSLEYKWFAVKEVQTDVLKWEDAGWEDVLTHETNVKGSLKTDKGSSK